MFGVPFCIVTLSVSLPRVVIVNVVAPRCGNMGAALNYAWDRARVYNWGKKFFFLLLRDSNKYEMFYVMVCHIS